MVPRPFPNPVAVFDDRFLFTTLNPKEVLSHGKASFCHPQTESPCVIFSRKTLLPDQHIYPMLMSCALTVGQRSGRRDAI